MTTPFSKIELEYSNRKKCTFFPSLGLQRRVTLWIRNFLVNSSVVFFAGGKEEEGSKCDPMRWTRWEWRKSKTERLQCNDCAIEWHWKYIFSLSYEYFYILFFFFSRLFVASLFRELFFSFLFFRNEVSNVFRGTNVAFQWRNLSLSLLTLQLSLKTNKFNCGNYNE